MRSYFVTLVLLLLAGLFYREIQLLPDGALHVHVLDVGQGDSILLVSPSGAQILIDGGPDLSVLEKLPRHMPFFDRSLDLVVVTHPDADHITGLPAVLNRYDVQVIMMTQTEHDSGIYDALRASIATKQIPVIAPDPAVDIVFEDGLILDTVWPPASFDGTSNNRSVVMRALYGDHAVLLTGDIEERAEDAILATGADVRADILKIAHHGSRTSSSTEFLLAVDPEIGLISAGIDNPYGHPHTDILNRHTQMGILLRSTVEEGTVSLRLP